MGAASRAALTAAHSLLAIRLQIATTPRRLQLASALLALSAIVFGVVSAHALSTRRQAVQSTQTTGQRLVQAVDISAHLSDAHATAAYSFLQGGPEPARTRDEYVAARDAAAAGVAALAAEIGTSPHGRDEIRRITLRLPEYTGLIDSARANFRRGYPLGSAYLRQASNTMRDEMLPAARTLYEVEARNLTASLRSGVSSSAVLVVVLAACALLALLAATQVYMARATRRIVNVRLLVASAIVLGLTAWLVGALALQRGALVRAQSSGSDPIELLTATRILALRAQAIESISLAARGGGLAEASLSQVDRGFKAVTAPIPNLLGQAAAVRSTATIDTAYRRYRAAHREVVAREQVGEYSDAVALAVRSGKASTRAAAKAFTTALDSQTRAAQASFRTQIESSSSKLAGLGAGIPLLTVLAALLALAGVRERLEEYR